MDQNCTCSNSSLGLVDVQMEPGSLLTYVAYSQILLPNSGMSSYARLVLGILNFVLSVWSYLHYTAEQQNRKSVNAAYATAMDIKAGKCYYQHIIHVPASITSLDQIITFSEENIMRR